VRIMVVVGDDGGGCKIKDEEGGRVD